MAQVATKLLRILQHLITMPYKTAPTVDDLVAGWIPHFLSADREIRWLELETEHKLYLNKDTLLLGKLDAFGIANEEYFFADWKSIGPYRKMEEVKATYCLDPQMLTYGVLLKRIASRFLVRWARKTSPPSYDFEWYRYNEKELDHWQDQLLRIASHIRAFRRLGFDSKHWITNFQACYKYGTMYPCPFYSGCAVQDFSLITPELSPRVSHLKLEREHDDDNPNLVILDATRVKTWLDCQERYRRTYEPGGHVEAPGESLATGLQFHDLLHRYYERLLPAPVEVPECPF